MQGFIDFYLVLWLREEKKAFFVSQKCFSDHYRITIMILYFLFLLLGWKRCLCTMPAPGGYCSTNKGPVWHLWKNRVLLHKADWCSANGLQGHCKKRHLLHWADQIQDCDSPLPVELQEMLNFCSSSTYLWRVKSNWTLKMKHLPQFPPVLAIYCFCVLQIPASGKASWALTKTEKDLNLSGWHQRESNYSLTYPHFSLLQRPSHLCLFLQRVNRARCCSPLPKQAVFPSGLSLNRFRPRAVPGMCLWNCEGYRGTTSES